MEEKRLFIMIGASLSIVLVAVLTTEMGRKIVLYGAGGIVLLIGVILCASLGSGEGTREVSRYKGSNLVSCRKCGYLGVSSMGYCPRCGSTTAYDIGEKSKIISCRKCGYLGVGPGNGYCPHCGWNCADTINK